MLHSHVPTSLKKLKPFLRLAHDLKGEGSAETRVIAYYCEKHAVELGLPLLQALQQSGAPDPPQGFVLELMDQVEASKATLGDAFSEEREARKLVGNYALKVFKKADDVDRAGMANKATARTYLIAVRLLSAMAQFADDPTDVAHYDQIQKYAMVKAASIMRAIKAGVRPMAGPPTTTEGDAMVSGAAMAAPPVVPTAAAGAAGAPQVDEWGEPIAPASQHAAAAASTPVPAPAAASDDAAIAALLNIPETPTHAPGTSAPAAAAPATAPAAAAAADPMQRGIAIATRAVQEDTAGNWAAALDLYRDSLGLLMEGCKHETDAAKKAQILALVPGYMNRAEQLKKMVAVPEFDAQGLAALPSSDPAALARAAQAVASANALDRAGNGAAASAAYTAALTQLFGCYSNEATASTKSALGKVVETFMTRAEQLKKSL